MLTTEPFFTTLLGSEEYNEAGVSVMPLEVALRRLIEITG
jgi:hypothetical protein